jgi:phage protein D/phage baseplate assembly protein gpV
MSARFELASQITIKVNGTEVDPEIVAHVLTVDVDQHVHLPDTFIIAVHDPDFEQIDGGPFDLTKEVEVAAQAEGGDWIVLVKGEITALEPAFQEGMIAYLVVRGYDKSHRLYRDQKSQAHLNKKDSDLAQEIAGAAGLQADVESTPTVYDHIFQHNQSDLAFLQERAWRIGYECFVQDGTLHFRRPPGADRGTGLTLTWGDNLLSFNPRMNLAEQVDEVVVRGWSVANKEAIVGRAKRGALYPGIEETRDGAAWARSFGSGRRVVLDQHVVSQAEADELAKARLDELSGAFVQAEGVALRRPDIRAGRTVRLEALGDRFSGTYLVTNARHTYSAEGLKTTFTVTGTRTGQLTEAMGLRALQPRYPGAVVGIVTDTQDPQHWGRVKVKFPWMTEDADSEWARVMGIGAGPEAGLFFIPAVDDEVLVLFEQGDFQRPYVIGGLWNGRDAPPPEAPSGGNERPLVRTWRSREGHHITVYDNADNKIEVVTKGGHQLVLDDANSEVTLKTNGGLVLTMADSGSKITIEGNEISIKANGNLKVESGANMDLQAGGQVNIQGALINLN